MVVLNCIIGLQRGNICFVLIFVSTEAALTLLLILRLHLLLLFLNDSASGMLLFAGFCGLEGLWFARDGPLEAFVEVALQVTFSIRGLVLVRDTDS